MLMQLLRVLRFFAVANKRETSPEDFVWGVSPGLRAGLDLCEKSRKCRISIN